MKLTKRAAAVLLAVLMAITIPLTAFAEGSDPNFTLTVNNEKLYAAMSYDVTAKITNATENEVSGIEGFAWSISSTLGSVSINSKNNYSKTLNSDGETYTVTESATFEMPQAGATVTVSASLGAREESLSRKSLKPIDSYEFSVENNDHCYYDENSNTIYLDRSSDTAQYAANVSISNIQPQSDEDRVTANVGGFPYEKYEINDDDDNLKTLTLAKNATGKGSLNLITESGKTPNFLDVQCCVETEKYTLNYKKAGDKNVTQLYKQEDTGDEPIKVTFPSNFAVEGKAFEITATNLSENSNDFIDYTLYTDEELTNKAPTTYYTKTGNNCELSINVGGQYFLECVNRSCDNGMLKRSLSKVIVNIVVSKAYPIQSVSLYELDENGNKTDKKLEKITLYTDTSNETKTYPLAKSVSVEPSINTDTVKYESTNKNVATVDATGLITAVGKGTATVWAMSTDNANAAAPLTVEVKKGIKGLSNISFADNTVEIPSGHVKQLKLTVNPTDAEQQIFWSTSNPDVLTVDKNTGLATAKDVDSPVSVTVYAATESNVTTSTPVMVVPAKRADSVKISVTGSSDTFSVDDTGTYPVYSDYNTASPKTFTLSAQAICNDGSESNDELKWMVTYDNGIVMSFDEAVDEGLLTYTKSGTDYVVTFAETEPYLVTCTATTNVIEPQVDDPYDAATFKLIETATILTLVNENTAKELSNGNSINVPIGGTVTITAKASTPSNSKTADPPEINITQGGDYVNVTSAPTLDGEGISYTIEGLKYGAQVTKILFRSRSSSVSKTINFYVRNNIAAAEVNGVSDMPYNNSTAITFPDLSLTMNGSSLSTSQYSVAYADNKEVGTATITITGKDMYAGSVKIVTFNILPVTIADAVISSIADQSLSETVTGAEPKPTVKIGTKTLTLNKDYTLSYMNNTSSGVATVIVTGTGNYKDSISAEFNVKDIMSRCTVQPIDAQQYSGIQITPEPVVTYKGRTLEKDVDYTVSYSNNINVGTDTAKITVTGKGLFTGTTSATFSINPTSFENCTIDDIKDQSLSSTTRKVEPKPVVKANGKTLSNGKDYTLSYINNTSAGYGTVIVTGMGNYSGEIAKAFRVIDDIKNAYIASIPVQTYTGGGRTPVPVINYEGKLLVKGVDFNITYSNNTKVGYASAVIEGIGFFKGKVTKNFIIGPKAVSLNKLKAGKKSLTIKWGTQANVSGYQVQYALNKTFTKKAKTVTVTGKNSYKAKKLKGKKKYYVRVRSYATIKGQKYYGPWSVVKSKKTKK